MKCLSLSLCFVLAIAARPAHAAEQRTYDLVIYGGTSAAVAGAIQAKRMDKTVVIVSPDTHLGGLTSGGLGWTDSGNKDVIGGISREFYRRVKAHYDKRESWIHQKSEKFGLYRRDDDAMWTFEPHVAEQVFNQWVKELDIPVVRDAWLDRASGVKRDGARIISITTTAGKTYAGRMFLDATYEGDLIAAAGVSYTVGRESNATYGETINGVQTARAVSHQFSARVDPYVIAGDPTSGLLPRIHDDDPGTDGDSDKRIQAYNFRTCLTNVPANRVPFPKPEGYDPKQYELLLRTLLASSRHVFGKFDPVPNGKTDTNNHGSFSTDNIGMNYDYPEASYERRREIIKEHESYQKGFYYFLCNDARVPQDVRERMSKWGLSKDEFTDNGNWPHQIYVREARRMIGEGVVTELHLRLLKQTQDSVGMGSYKMDSHNTQRYVARDADGNAYARNEGDIQISPGGPYPIGYGALVPKSGECDNLLVPVCVSSSHIAYGSIRMEPVFMVLGQSAATAAGMAIDAGVPVQKVDYSKLRTRLLADGQLLKFDRPPLTLPQ
jgi:FAD-dependent oxidoreductase family protein